jgi:hypothetical protein
MRPYPESPFEKMKLRLSVAKLSGRLDLASKASWTSEHATRPNSIDVTPLEGDLDSEAVNVVGEVSQGHHGNIAFAKRVMGAKFDHRHDVEHLQSTVGGNKVDFRLIAVPDEVFKLTSTFPAPNLSLTTMPIPCHTIFYCRSVCACLYRYNGMVYE